MTTIPLPQIISHSRLASLRACPRKHYYEYELRLQADAEAQPLRVGRAVHLGIELRANGIAVADAISKAVEGFDDSQAFDRAAVEALLAGYFWYWERPEILPEWTITQTVETERSFVLPILNPLTSAPSSRYKFGGTIDAVVNTADGAMCVRETKTTGDDIGPESDYWLRLRIDPQISGYLYAARRIGHDVHDVLYDVIAKPKLRPKGVPLLDEDGCKIVTDASGGRVRTKDGKKWRETAEAALGYTMQTRPETPEEYRVRILEDIEKRPETYYARRRIPRLSSDMRDWQHELWAQMQALNDHRKTNRWWRNPASCLGFGRCQFIDICHRGIEPGDEIPAGFHTRELSGSGV